MDWVFLTTGGFLLGSLLYTGYYTTRYEPEVKTGYILLGIGITLSVITNGLIELTRELPLGYKIPTILSWLIVAIGITAVVRARRQYRREGK